MNIEDLPDNSESSDEDYVPEGTNAELPSEEDSDGDAEDALSETDDLNKGSRKRAKRQRKTKKKQKSAKEETIVEPNDNQNLKQKQEKTANLWADFIKDTGFKTRAERSQSDGQTSSDNTPITDKKPEERKLDKLDTKVEERGSSQKTKITEIYKFAGEEIKVEKEVYVSNPLPNTASVSKGLSKKSAGGSGGIGSFLNQIGKKTKINTLEKSKLDWDKFKKEEDIEDELQAYGKSKDGYLERQDFLNRADLRRFEIEKEIRNSLRTNKMNNFNV